MGPICLFNISIAACLWLFCPFIVFGSALKGGGCSTVVDWVLLPCLLVLFGDELIELEGVPFRKRLFWSS